MAARIRPATPLAVFLFAAFAMLLISTLSSPIIRGIPLATFKDVNFGVFGYCDGDKCSSLSIGYSADSAFSKASNSDFNLPTGTRTTLSAILVLHPIATLLCLIGFGLAVASHFHRPAHSTRFLLGQLLFIIPTLVVVVGAFIVDFLLFSPHQAFGVYFVLAAAVLLLFAAIICTFIRRTVLGRKQRQQRIAENAEMNGANYYAQRAAESAKLGTETLTSADTNGSNADGLPRFATYDKKDQEEDRTPLNPHSGTMKSSNSAGTQGGLQSLEDGASRYDDKPPLPPIGPGGRLPPPPRDPYGNPTSSLGPQGMPPLHNQNFNGAMGPGGPRGPPAPTYNGRGRGGFPPQRGGYPSRGGYGGPPPGRGRPPPGWNGPGGRGRPPPPRPGPGMGPPPMMAGRGRGPSPVYNDRYYDGPPGEPGYPPQGPYARQMSPAQQGGYNAEAPIGMAVEMDGVNGRPSQSMTNYGLRDSDGDVEGMIGLQQQRSPQDGDDESPSSVYSENRTPAFVPARAAWNQSREQSPLSRTNKPPDPISPPPRTLSPGAGPGPTAISSPRSSTDQYYEDVDARFASDPSSNDSMLPGALRPGGYPANPPRLQTDRPPVPKVTSPAASFEFSPEQGHISSYSAFLDPVRDAPGGEGQGARSPAGSEASHFTSVSQRGVNPDWRPPPGQPMPSPYGPYGGAPSRPRKDDMVLSNNPEFAVPGAGLGRGGGRGRGMRGGGAPRGRGGMVGLGPGGMPGRF